MRTYEELKKAVADWMYRTDLDAVIPQFIAFAEADIFRQLRVRDLERFFTGDSVNKRIALPDDFVAVKSMKLAGDMGYALRLAPVEEVNTTKAYIPIFYAIQGNDIVLNQDGEIEAVICIKPAPLSENNSTNIVLIKYPSLYLWGALRYACNYVKDAENEAAYLSQFTQAMSEINNADYGDRYAGKLTSRVTA